MVVRNKCNLNFGYFFGKIVVHLIALLMVTVGALFVTFTPLQFELLIFPLLWYIIRQVNQT